jgi:alkanesulfonate monooxygenase SsuD/methylene tetrahydromethanopterin reductase-like flavin-dependent oxidoreductase (luciferase family)
VTSLKGFFEIEISRQNPDEQSVGVRTDKDATAAEVPMVLTPLRRPHPPLWYGVTTPEASVWAARERASIATLVR